MRFDPPTPDSVGIDCAKVHDHEYAIMCSMRTSRYACLHGALLCGACPIAMVVLSWTLSNNRKTPRSRLTPAGIGCCAPACRYGMGGGGGRCASAAALTTTSHSWRIVRRRAASLSRVIGEPYAGSRHQSDKYHAGRHARSTRMGSS